MHRTTLVLLALAASTPLGSAQVGPGSFAPSAADSFFTSAQLTKLCMYRSGATDKRIAQINFTKTPTVDKKGQYTVALTLYDLAPTYGGSSSGGAFVVTGQYDTNTTPHTFTPNKHVNAMNDTSSGPCSSLMIEPRDAMCCAVDRKDGIWFSVRSSVTAPFPKPVRVTTAVNTPGIPTGNYVEAVPCFVDQGLVMIYADKSREIVCRQIELSWDANLNLKGAELQTVHVVARTTHRPHSPTPVIDALGNVRGLWMGIANGTDSDMYLAPGLNPKDQPQKVFDSTGFMGSGGVRGGKLYASSDGSVVVGRVAWLLGSNTPAAGGYTATVTCGVDNPKRPFSPCTTRLAVSTQPNAGVNSGVSVPGWNGDYALNSPEFVFATITSNDIDDVAHWSATVPKDKSLVGMRASIQGLALPSGEKPTLTNTATLEFR